VLLVTGWSGFIGSHLVERLEEEGISYRKFVGDVRSEADVVRNLRDVDGVIHLAALTYVPPSFHSPEAYFQTNTLGTWNFLRNWDMFKRFIYVSTSHVYGLQESFPITEEATPNPIDPYSLSKLAAEKLVWMKGVSENRDFVILRPFNNYGPGHARTYAIPTMTLQALREGRVTLRGDSERDFTYVSDTVGAMIRVVKAERLQHRIYNITSGHCYRMSQIAETICQLIGANPGHVEVLPKPNRPLDIPKLHGSAERIHKLGWMPRVSLEEGLRRTIGYWRSR